MSDGKLEAAKEAALGLAARLTASDRLTVVSFASDVQVHLDAVPVTKENARKIRSEISRLQTRGMTFLSGGWFAGVECAARIAEEDSRMTPRVIILSDGHANEGIIDREELCEHASELRSRGVLTSALGIGDGYDEQLLRGIAANGGGRLHDAEFTTEISSVLLGELDDIFGTVVEEAQIELTYPGAVRIELIGSGQSILSEGRAVVRLGAVQNEVERLAIFKVICPVVRQGDELHFEVTGCGRAVEGRSAVATEAVTARLLSVDRRINRTQPVDQELADLVARTWSAHVVSTAAKMNRDGAYQDAEKYVGEQLRHFRRYVAALDRGGEMVRELELLARGVGRQFSARMSKEMVVQSALMMERRVDRRGTGKESWSMRLERGD